MLKVMTVVGTRPELIRLSRVIARLDDTVEHVLVHTGQNYDYALNEVFFHDLGIRELHCVFVDGSVAIRQGNIDMAGFLAPHLAAIRFKAGARDVGARD